MKTKVKSRNGISLIVLVITIIVMIVLAGAIILALNNSGVIGKASMGRVKSDLSTLMEEVQVKVAERKLNGLDIDGRYKLSDWGIENSTYENRVIIDKGNLRVLNSDEDDDIKKAAIELEIMTNTASTTLKNTTGKKLLNYRIYGNSVQNGIPSPDKPVEIESLGDLVTETGDVNYGKYKIPIKVGGKNLLKTYGYSTESINSPTAVRKITNSYGTTISTIDPVNGVTVMQSTVGNSSLPSSYLNGYFCIGINDEIKYNHKYKLSFDIQIIDNPLNSKEAYFMSNGSNAFKADWSTGKVNTEFTWLANSDKPDANFLEIRCQGASFKIWNIMITEVENDYTYEEYREPTITNIYLNEPLRKVADYADYVDFRNNKIVRQVGKQNLADISGTFDKYHSQPSLGDYSLFFTLKFYDSIAGKCMCSHFPVAVNYLAKSNHITVGSSSNRIYIGIDSNIVPASQGKAFREWLNANNPILYYALKNQTEENISLPDLSTLNGTTIISVMGENGVEASNILVEY